MSVVACCSGSAKPSPSLQGRTFSFTMMTHISDLLGYGAVRHSSCINYNSELSCPALPQSKLIKPSIHQRRSQDKSPRHYWAVNTRHPPPPPLPSTLLSFFQTKLSHHHVHHHVHHHIHHVHQDVHVEIHRVGWPDVEQVKVNHFLMAGSGAKTINTETDCRADIAGSSDLLSH